jgi:signal transduction histidine kinase
MTGEEILVVDDDASVRGAIQMVLERTGYTVASAADGAEALAAMDNERPDLVIADITMPTMDGYDFYRAVRENPEWGTLPIIFLTGRTSREDRLKGKALGVEDYLEKPPDLEELMIVVRAKLDRARDLQASTENEVLRLKEELARALSHELRTPLTWIIGYTEMAMGYIDKMPPEELGDLLGHVLKGGDRIERLADDLVTLIHIDTGELTQEMAEAMVPHDDVATIVRRTVVEYEGRAAAQGLDLQMEIDGPLPTVVLSEELFSDGLGRLIDNAIKFSGETGTEVRVVVRAVGDRVETAVRDDGIGIAPRDRRHLFERFRQVDRERFEQQGVGLGLALARELVEIQHGTIAVESSLGEGSTFTISMPAVEGGGG